MRKMKSKYMQYKKTGTVKSKRKDIVNGMFKEMTVGEAWGGALRKTWELHSTEILAVVLFTALALDIWDRLG